MLKHILRASLLLTISCSAVSADTTTPAAESSNAVTGPQEVGTTSMPPGNYLIKEQTTGKTFELMVSTKGTMILAPAPAGTTIAAPAAAASPANASAASPQSNLTNLGTNALKKMVQDQVTKGVTNVIQKDATNSLGKFIK
ncbi:MAG: hypothetical protein JST44_22415 [Cyanobacteria bacterium SZAS LIN-5]|nr:hypothetical protein [Cyanobacteria bacterium SZAS LIN-5]RTL41827.1 MAG: hypothetical protein EKK48_12990 [Candidatus Melainabacteria bacterium]